MKKRFVFLNSLPINMFQRYRQVRLTITQITPQQLKSMLQSWQDYKAQLEILSYIRHPSTVKAISEALGIDLQPNSGLYTYEPGDSIVVVSLKRPPRGQEVQVRGLEDLNIHLVTVEFAE